MATALRVVARSASRRGSRDESGAPGGDALVGRRDLGFGRAEAAVGCAGCEVACGEGCGE